MEIVRLTAPTLEEFFAAAEVCEIRWPYLRELHTRGRFEAFQRLGVELVVARNDGRFEGVCFILPCEFPFGGETLRWVCPFQLATRPEARSVGGLLFLKISGAFPSILSMGVTEDAKPFYAALRWKRHDDIWRGIHPVVLGRMIDDYRGRLRGVWAYRGLRALGFLYDAVGPLVEHALALGVRLDHEGSRPVSGPAALALKEEVVRRYLDVMVVSSGPRCANVGGIGRVLGSSREGWGNIRQHALLWSELRRRGAGFCEVLVGSRAARRQAIALGYLLVRMPAYYVDRDGTIAKLLEAFRRGDVSFLHLDKSI